jgi:21S rRNA (uridine2791-2'-O)-methyltransferase
MVAGTEYQCTYLLRVMIPTKIRGADESTLYRQVAIELTKPYGRVLGVDLIPTQPPKGVSTIQGNFLSPDVQNDIKHFLRDPDRGRLRPRNLFASSEEEAAGAINAKVLEELEKGYIDLEKEESAHAAKESGGFDSDAARTVDVVLSDMCEPWEQTTGFWKRSLTDPYHRMMNTSGNSFRDHAGSMVSLGRGKISQQVGKKLMASHLGPLPSRTRV